MEDNNDIQPYCTITIERPKCMPLDNNEGAEMVNNNPTMLRPYTTVIMNEYISYMFSKA